MAIIDTYLKALDFILHWLPFHLENKYLGAKTCPCYIEIHGAVRRVLMR